MIACESSIFRLTNPGETMKLTISFDRNIILDGSTGTYLQQSGMPSGVCTEKWISENTSLLIDLQRAYVAAGSEMVYAPTFGANRIKLAKYNLESELEKLNTQMVVASQNAVGGSAFVGGNLSSLGVFPKPYGQFSFSDYFDVYLEQALVLEAAGVDFFVAETLTNLTEARAALLAVKSISDKPFLCSMTFESNSRTLSGSLPEVCLSIIQSMGASAFGLNCSSGPKDALILLKRMEAYADIPLLVKPNAGLPREDGAGNTIYDMSPDKFVSIFPDMIDSGARLLGGCCGTTPAHIRALSVVSQNTILSNNDFPKNTKDFAVNERKIFSDRISFEPSIKISADTEFASNIFEAGSDDMLIITVGSGFDIDAFEEGIVFAPCPVAFDCDSDALAELVLRVYNGRAYLFPSNLTAEFVAQAAVSYGALVL